VQIPHNSATYGVDIYAEDKSIDYDYDLAGNITRISVDDEVKYTYTYDPHGRLTGETDYVDGKYHEYIYNTTGNIHAHWTYALDEDGQPSSTGTVRYYTYGNSNWPDQLSAYDGESIVYDSLGNPTEYYNNCEFEWQRGRQLASVKFDADATVADVTYKYNENGLRTYKDTADTTTIYEWDEATLIRELVTYKATNRTYDIWYFYDNTGSVIGFEYSCINDLNEKSTTRIYYEKDLQGNVIGLLDSRGAEIATYFYDAWGNITTSMCYEGYEVPFVLNHITYRGYYRDNETGFYYLQSRYYDAGICRFINADDVAILGMQMNSMYKDNLYAYCNCNPVNYIDPSGYDPVGTIIGAILGFGLGALLVPRVADWLKLRGWGRKIFISLGVVALTGLGAYVGNYVGEAIFAIYKAGGEFAFVINKAIANGISKIVGGTIKTASGNGWIINVGKYTLRIMTSGGGRTNYFRLSHISKGALTILGKYSSDRGQTHIPITFSNIIKIINLIIELLKK